MRRILIIVALTLLAAASAKATCTSEECGTENEESVEAFRAEVQARCECESSKSHAKYERCVERRLNKARKAGVFSRSCARSILRCEERSTCGRPEAVVCCRDRGEGRNGRVKGAAKRCRRGSVCEALTSEFDACSCDGGCARKTCTPNIVDRESDVTPIHDPAIYKQKGTYYLYSSSPLLSFYSSKDMRRWKHEGQVFNEFPDWIKRELPDADHIGAPDITRYRGRYILFYQSHYGGTCNAGTAYLSNTTLDPTDPEYEWVDHGLVLRSVPQGIDLICGDGETWYNAIDAHLFVDADGSPWLAFGSTLGGIKLAKLDPETLQPVTTPAEFVTLAERSLFQVDPIIEAPYIIRRGRYYYLFLSHNRCCQGPDTRYQIRVGRSRNLAGPYVDKEGIRMLDEGGTLLIDEDGPMIGTGHNDVFTDGGVDWLVHHGYDSENDYEPVLNIRTILWDADGWPSVCRSDAEAPAEE